MRSYLVYICVCVCVCVCARARVRAALQIINFKMQIILICSSNFCIKLQHGDEE